MNQPADERYIYNYLFGMRSILKTFQSATSFVKFGPTLLIFDTALCIHRWGPSKKINLYPDSHVAWNSVYWLGVWQAPALSCIKYQMGGSKFDNVSCTLKFFLYCTTQMNFHEHSLYLLFSLQLEGFHTNGNQKWTNPGFDMKDENYK